MFRGRIKPPEQKANLSDLTRLPNRGQAFIYQRLSTHEQMTRHVFGLEAQDALINLAREDGYADEQIHVEKRDLGISGTTGSENRPGLAYLIESIEAGRVEAVYVVDISRLYRDQTLVNAFSLGELLKAHSVILVTPSMRLNLGDEMHMRMYRMVADQAAQELKVMRQRLYGARSIKAKTGRYAGEPLPTGYVVDDRQTIDGKPNPAYHTYLIHEPHAKVVRFIFQQLSLGQTLTQIVTTCREQGITLPPFPPELDIPANKKALQRTRKNPDGSWPISKYMVRSMATNPAYIGWKLWERQVVGEDVYPPIIKADIFWYVQKQFGEYTPRPRRGVMPLSGLLHCQGHGRMSFNNKKDRKNGYYICPDCQISITASIVDQPLAEAILGEICLPGLAEGVLARLGGQDNQDEVQIATHRQEIKRLEGEVDNLKQNLINLGSTGILDQADYLAFNRQIEQRRQRIFELNELAAALEVKKVDIDRVDIEQVAYYLGKLLENWDRFPDKLKNIFFRIIIHKIEISRDGQLFTVRIHWRVGSVYTLRIFKPYRGRNVTPWTDEEKEILRTHWPTASQDELIDLLPGKSWVSIRGHGKATGIERLAPPKRSKSPRPFTAEEDELVRRFYAGEIDKAEATQTGRSLMAIYARSSKLHLGHRDYSPSWEWVEKGATAATEGYLSKQEPQSEPGYVLDVGTILDISRILQEVEGE